MAVLWVDHAFDSLKAISAYKGDQVPGIPHTNHKSSNFNKRVNPAMLVKNASTKLALILHIIHGQIQLRLNCIIITQIIDTLILVQPRKIIVLITTKRMIRLQMLSHPIYCQNSLILEASLQMTRLVILSAINVGKLGSQETAQNTHIKLGSLL